MRQGHDRQMPQGPAPGIIYAGFWVRALAVLIDMLIALPITIGLTWLFYGNAMFTEDAVILGPADFLINWVLPAIIVIAFWMRLAGTPGKLVLRLSVVRAESGQPIGLGQAIGRYFAYILSAIPLLAGYIWAAFDQRKQGWHDKLAGTVVIRRLETQPGGAS